MKHSNDQFKVANVAGYDQQHKETLLPAENTLRHRLFVKWLESLQSIVRPVVMDYRVATSIDTAKVYPITTLSGNERNEEGKPRENNRCTLLPESGSNRWSKKLENFAQMVDLRLVD